MSDEDTGTDFWCGFVLGLAAAVVVFALIFLFTSGFRKTRSPDLQPRTYEAKQVGSLKFEEKDWSPRLFVVQIEGHRYYATETYGPFFVLGPEVPADAWTAIKKRIGNSDYEFIELDEMIQPDPKPRTGRPE